MRSGSAEKSTPMPSDEASAIEENPSSIDFDKSRFGGFPNPSSIAPRIVIDPMQKSKNAVTNPSEKLLSFELSFFLR